MYISKTIKVVLSTLTIGSLAGGGYLAKTFLSNNVTQNNSSQFSEKEKESLEENPIKTEYIRKEFIQNGKKQICEITKRGKEQEETLSKEKCLELVEKIWGRHLEKQPDIWLRTDIDGFEKEINNYSNLKNESNSLELNKDWKTEGNILSCSSYIDTNNEKKAIISCNYLVESNSLNLLEFINKV